MLVFCYPEEVELGGVHALLDDVQATGASGLAVALTYHRARRVFPRYRQVSHAPPGCTSFEPDRSAYGALAPSRTADPRLHGRLLALRSACAERGVAFHAWLVALHHEPLARRWPDLAAQTVDGTPAEHALCPSRQEVVEYCAALVGDVCRQFEPDGVELEAALYPGWEPAYTLTLALDPVPPLRAALAAQCFCPACSDLIGADGLQEQVAAAAFGAGEVDAEALVPARERGAIRLLGAARGAAGDTPLRVLGFGPPELLALQGLTDAAASAAGGVGVGMGTLSGAALDERWAAIRAHLPSHAPLASLNWAPGRDVAADARRLTGAGEIALYNLSLMPA